MLGWYFFCRTENTLAKNRISLNLCEKFSYCGLDSVSIFNLSPLSTPFKFTVYWIRERIYVCTAKVTFNYVKYNPINLPLQNYIHTTQCDSKTWWVALCVCTYWCRMYHWMFYTITTVCLQQFDYLCQHFASGQISGQL